MSTDTIFVPLFVPANRADRFEKAAASGADAVILDLEDAVADQDKHRARSLLRCDFTNLPVIVRINASGSSWHEQDLAAVMSLPVAAVMLPKSEDPQRVGQVCRVLKNHAPLWALIESAQGLSSARAIAALEGVSRLVFGSIDFCADLGCAHLPDILLPARSELVLASRLAGIAAPIDGITAQLENQDEIFRDACHSRALGMGGKLCVHPRQIAEVRRAFAPTEEEIGWANRVLSSAHGAVAVDGEMVDEPVKLRARAVLANAAKWAKK